MYYNMYVLSSVPFGCSIISLNKREENELRRLHEAPALSELDFSATFPRDIMHVWNDVLGLGLFLLTKMIVIYGLKLHLRNKRICRMQLE